MTVSRAEAARRAGVTAGTLARWAGTGVVPQARDGEWSPAAVAHARLVARLRERGHSLQEIRDATQSGRLAFGVVEDLLAIDGATRTLADAAAATGLEPALVQRILLSLGFSATALDELTDADVALLRRVADVLGAGLPLVALLQLVRVYGHALAQIADAEVRLFHLHVHQPLLREQVPGVEIAEELDELARRLLPLSAPIMDHLHRRFLAHFLEQDVIGHLEGELAEDPADLGRLQVVIAFADLTGYTELTEERGEEEAVDAVERFIEQVEITLPDDARVIKTIGDEVMVVGADAGALVDWGVGFQRLMAGSRPAPRVGIHTGPALYRDGDYYGRCVNQAARVVARAAAGEVLVTRQVVDAAGSHVEFEPLGEVRLKGFSDATELFVARAADDDA
jgi:adenylate cyclase